MPGDAGHALEEALALFCVQCPVLSSSLTLSCSLCFIFLSRDKIFSHKRIIKSHKTGTPQC